MGWSEVSSPIRQSGYPRRLSLRRGPNGEVVWTLVSQRANAERAWEHLGVERVALRLINGQPRLHCWSRCHSRPVYFRDFTFRPEQAAQFLAQMAKRVEPHRPLRVDDWMSEMVTEFCKSDQRLPHHDGSWRLFFLRAHFPLFHRHEALRAEWVPSPLIAGFRRADAEGLASWLMDCRGKRTLGLLYEHLIDELRNPQPNWGKLLHLRMVKGMGVSPDQVQELLNWPAMKDREESVFRMTQGDFVAIRHLLRQLPEHRRFSFVESNYFWSSPTWSTLPETAKWWLHQSPTVRELAFEGAGSLGDLKLLADHVECQTNSRPIHPTPWVTQLRQSNFGQWQLEAPEETKTLALWGREFRNCAARFAVPVAAGTTHVIRVSQQGGPRYLLEIQGRRLVQFLGPSNQPPLPEDRDDLARALAAQGLLERLDLVV